MRVAFVLAIAGCYSNQPAPQSAGPGSGAGSATSPTTTTAQASYPPAAFTPPTTGLAVGVAAFVVIDDAGSRIFARNGKGVDILALDSGKRTGHVDVGWEGELWPAGNKLLALRDNGLSIDVTLIDPATAKTTTSCSATVKAPPNAAILRVDEFTTHAGTTYLKWETSPPPRQMGGARVSDEEMDAMNREFQDAYACGLYAIHMSGSRCTLDVASYKDAGLEACGTRSMPWNRYLPTPIGSLTLRVDRASGARNGLMIDTETLVVGDTSGKELWRLPVETRATPPPPP